MEDRSTCYNLTQEGERLFRMQKYEQGIDLLRQALEVGTDDFQLLSAIYCQLGNAHTMLKDYEEALKFHTYDILVERILGNKEGEAKSCANLGNIFKMKGAYNDALTFTFKQLDFAEELSDRVLKTRAYYNIATIYVERGRCSKLVASEQNLPEKEAEAQSDFDNAIKYFQMTQELAEKHNDPLTLGRCYGSLGNTYYCLKDYDESIKYHKLRLELSQQYGDRASMRRAHANIANCHALKSNIPMAIQHYKTAYDLANDLGNKEEEGQMAYSLANALYIGKEVQRAIIYFLRHLNIARNLDDQPGQLRSYYSLSLSFNNLRDYRKALYFLILAKRISLQVNDTGVLSDIDNLLQEITESGKTKVLIDDTELLIDSSADPNGPAIQNNELCILYFKKRSLNDRPVNTPEDPNAEERYEKEEFFDMLARLQSKRMNDQRVDVSVLNSNTDYKPRQVDTEPDNSSTDGSEVLIDLLLHAQSRRMEDQRAPPPVLPGLNQNGQFILRRLNTYVQEANPVTEELDSHLVEWLMRVQSQRLDEQRSELPSIKSLDELSKQREDDVTNIVLRMQAGRLEDQRAHLPSPSNPSSSSSNGNAPPQDGPSSSSSKK